jgi:hypothetical protein
VEFHPQPLTEPDLNLSRHPAPAIALPLLPDQALSTLTTGVVPLRCPWRGPGRLMGGFHERLAARHTN